MQPDGSYDTSKYNYGGSSNVLPTLTGQNASVNPFGTLFSPALAVYPQASQNASTVSPFTNGQKVDWFNTPQPLPTGGSGQLPTSGIAKNPFAMIANPFVQANTWQTKILPFVAQQNNAPQQNNGVVNTGRVNGMTADEAKWASIAAKMGLNWQVTKDVYMNPHRNGSANPAEALGRQMDDKTWGDVFAQVVGRAPNEREWIDHYNAGGNWAYDPLVGHNDAIAEVERRRQELQNQTNPQQYPDWYTPPA